MHDNVKHRDLAHGEAKSKIYWGTDVEDVVKLLRSNYGIEGDEANSIIADAVIGRKSAIRKKASISLVFAVIGLAVSVTYFALQGLVGFVVIGVGPILMALLGLASVAMTGGSVHRLVTGETTGPA
jgi:hypothetical protein